MGLDLMEKGGFDGMGLDGMGLEVGGWRVEG